MSSCLQINSDKWNLWGSDGLKLFLPREGSEKSIYFQIDWSFVASDVDPATVPAEVPKLRLHLIGHVPALKDWRALENLYLGYQDRIDAEAELRGPDIWIFQPGADRDPLYGNWETSLKFGARNGYEFEFSLEALRRSARASQYQIDNGMKQFFQQAVPADWEHPEWVNEGDELSFEGKIDFKELFCSTPINSAQPLEWARQLARRELAMNEFGLVTLTDADHPGKYKTNEGIRETGRLVVFQMPAS